MNMIYQCACVICDSSGQEKPFFITVFKYSFVLLFKSNFITSMLKSSVIMACLIVLSFSILDKEFSRCSVNSFTSFLG